MTRDGGRSHIVLAWVLVGCRPEAGSDRVHAFTRKVSAVTTLGILASGRGSNASAILDAIAENVLPARVGVLLSDRPDAPALSLARSHGVPANYLDPGRPGARLTPSAETTYADAMQAADVQWVILAGFMRILGPVFLDRFPGRVLNIHPSLLPSFPGLHAQRQALEHGVKIAGATVHFVDHGVDTGPIIAQAAVPVLDDDTESTLAARILESEHRLYVHAIQQVLAGIHRQGRRVVLSK